MNKACTCCENDRNTEGKAPRTLTILPRRTPRKGNRVWACEFCDGPVINLATRTDNSWFDPAIIDE